MKRRRNIFISFAVVLVFLAAGAIFIERNPAVDTSGIKYVKIAGQSIKVNLAITPAEQEQGLSGRPGLAPEEGMLFVFDKPSQYYFWMKDMNFAIDMIWISEDLHVLYIKKDARPESYPEGFGPDTPAKYVLEVASGFSERHNLGVGDEILFTY